MSEGNLCDSSLLRPSSRCIVGSEDGEAFYWGYVVSVIESDRYLQVLCKLTGDFKLDDRWEPVGVDSGVSPSHKPYSNGRVYPDNETTRQLIWSILRAKEDAAKSRAYASSVRQLHFDTVLHLARYGVVLQQKKDEG